MSNTLTPMDLGTKIKMPLLKDAPLLKSLNVRQRRFLRRYLIGKDRATAWMEVYGCKDRLTAMVGSRTFLVNNPEIVQWLYEMAGVGDDDIMRVIRESMVAEKPIVNKNGEVTKEVPDHYARIKSAELAMKLRGLDKKPDAPQNNMNVIIVSDKEAGVFKVIEGEEA